MRFPSNLCYFGDSSRVLFHQYQVNTCSSPLYLFLSNFDSTAWFDSWFFVGDSCFSCASFRFGVSGCFFYALSPHRHFFTRTGNMCYSLFFYLFLLPEDSYCLIDASLSDLVPSLLVPPIYWLFLVHIVVGCCFLSFPFCCLNRGIPATFFLDSAFCRSLFSPFDYGSAPFEISPCLFRVILVPGSASVVSFTDSFLFLCFFVVPFLL